MEHECKGLPRFIWDQRNDNNFIPPKPEVRPRCMTCGWQGSWQDAVSEMDGT